MAYDGSIRINTRIDGKGFNTGVKSMMASLGSLAAAIGVVFSVQQMVQFGKTSVQTAMQMEAGWQGLRYMANAYGKDLGHIKEFLNEYTEDGLVPMMNAQQAYKNMLARGYSTDQLEKMLLIMKDSAVYLRKGQLDIGEAIEKTTMGLRTERSILTDSSGIEKNMYKMWQAYAKEMGTTISALTQEQKLIAEFQGFMKEGAVYAGAAAEYTETYAGKVAQLTAAMVGLKVSVGNMLIPLLNALLPKIIAMVKWFTYWFNIIGRVLNLLFGTNVGMKDAASGAQDAADATGEMAGNLEDANKAAKGSLAAFDKLNVLAQADKASGGGGGGDVGLPVEEDGLFPEMEEQLDEMEEKLRGFVTRVKEFFAPLGEAFSRLGESLGKLKDAVVGAFEMFFPGGIDFGAFGENLRDGVIFFIDLLAKAVEGFANWIEENPDAFMVLATLFAGIAVAALAVYAPTLLIVAGILLLIAAIGWLSTHWEETIAWIDKFKHQIIAFAAILAGIFIAPIAGLIVAIIGLGILIYENWESIKGWIIGAWEKIKETWETVAGWFDENVIQPVTEWFKQAWEDIKSFPSDAWEKIKGVWNKVSAWFSENVTVPVETFFSTAWDNIKGFFTGAWEDIKVVWETVSTWFEDNVWNPIQTKATEIWDGIVGVIKGAINGIIGFINGMINGIVSGINNVIGVLNNLSFSIPDWIPIIGGQTFSLNIPTLTAPQIPYLATGAVIPANAPFAAILGDQKSGTNIEAPLKTIEQAVDNVLARRGMNTSADSGLIHNVIKLDGQVLYDAYKKIDKRVGTSMIAGSGIR